MRTQSGHGAEMYTHALVQIDGVGGYLWELENGEVASALEELQSASILNRPAVLTFHPKDEDQFGCEFTFVGTVKGIQRFTADGAKKFKERQEEERTKVHLHGLGGRR